METYGKTLLNFDQLINFITQQDKDNLIKEIDRNYEYEKSYAKYKESRFKDLLKKRNLIGYLWHRYVTRSIFIGRLLEHIFGKRFPAGYFGGRPFECVFKTLTPAPYADEFAKVPNFSDAAIEIKENIEEYKYVYEKLCDELSKKTLFTLLKARLFRDPSLVTAEGIYITSAPPCFDKEIVGSKKDHVYVDCGGFNGDTVKLFTSVFQTFNKIYVYEPDQLILNKLKENLKNYNNVIIRNVGVSDGSKNISFAADGGGGGRLGSDVGVNIVETVSLDQDINEPITYIKMDIEGEELNALRGVKNHIKNESPILAINVYHKLGDIRKCLTLINKINPNYKFYLRHYGHSFVKTVLYAKV